MVLALVVLAGTSAMAQAGLTPAVTYEVAMGSTATFSVNDNSTNSTYAWDVFELATAHVVGAADGASVAATKVSIATPTAYTTTIKFYDDPAAGNLFVVQCTETETATGTCSTKRRFYVSVFDFDVQVIALGTSNTPPADATAWGVAATVQADCNSWSGDVIKNSLNSVMAAAMYADSVNNATNTELKLTDTYFAVRIHLTGATLNNYKTRIQWSMPSAANLEIYAIEALDATATGPKFSAEAGTTTWTAANANSAITEPTAYVGDVYNSEQTIYFPKTASADTEVVKVFRVRTHNLLGASDMVYDVRVDRVQLEKTAETAYNNGEKVHASTTPAVTTLARLDTNKDNTETTTIRQSPATQIIGVAD